MDIKDIAKHAAEVSPVAPQLRAVVPGRLVHVDADILAYQHSGDDDLGVCRRKLREHVALMVSCAGAEAAVLHLTMSGITKGDRTLIGQTKPYQGNRKGHKPKHWEQIREYMRSGQLLDVRKAILWQDREADDALAYAVTRFPTHVLCSLDKDLRMVYGWHLNWRTYELDKIEKYEYEKTMWNLSFGLKWFHHQLLEGDTADNIPGVRALPEFPRGVGKAAADKLLSQAMFPEEGWSIVQKAYEDCYGDTWARTLAEQAMLLWIRTDAEAHPADFVFSLPNAKEAPWVKELMRQAQNILEDVRIKKKRAAEIMNMADQPGCGGGGCTL